jgi:hypothetical protein
MTTTPDFRALLADDAYAGSFQSLGQYRTALLKALATPPPEPPTDDEIATAFQKGADQEFYATVEALTKYCDAGVELTGSDAREVLYELRRPHIVLDHWGNEKQ